MTEYTVHFQRGFRVGTRSLRMERVEAETPEQAIKVAKKTAFPDHREQRYGVVRVDHFDGDSDCLIIDWRR
ncbi:MAG: hypothetical protein ACRECF_05435 [Methyloceanibacter sp.]